MESENPTYMQEARPTENGMAKSAGSGGDFQDVS